MKKCSNDFGQLNMQNNFCAREITLDHKKGLFMLLNIRCSLLIFFSLVSRFIRLISCFFCIYCFSIDDKHLDIDKCNVLNKSGKSSSTSLIGLQRNEFKIERKI